MKRSITVLAAIALAVAACAGTEATPSSEGPTAPGNSADSRVDLRPVPQGVTVGLQQVDSCEVLLDYFIDRALEQVGPWGLGGGGWIVPLGREEAVDTAAADDGSGEAGADPTSTNVQVEGVDEGDIVKASGDRLFVISGERLLAFSTADGGIEQVGSVRLPGWSAHMLLEGDRLVVVGSGFDAARPVDDTFASRDIASDVIAPMGSPLTQITLVDVSDLAAPEVVHQLTMDGSPVTTRLVDGRLRLVLEAYPVGLDWVQPEGSGLRAEREATEQNREIIRSSTIDNWLPYYVGDAGEGSVLDCADVLLPPEPSGLGTLSILDFDISEGIESWGAASVVASGSTVYANLDRTYVATSIWMDPAAITSPEDFDGHTTRIHRFDTPVDGDMTYVASGEVDGFLLNQFAMDEFEGNLRVASTTTPDWWGGGGAAESESQVTVLSTEGDRLETIGSVGELGVTETIRAVRFMGPVGYVVTFRQTDPLYVIDLSDPTEPVAAGELKIPGYSAYLHPVADGRLLGVGQDADPETGAVHGLQLSLFDVSDPTNPVRVDTFDMDVGDDGPESNVWSPIEGDHKAFTSTGDGGLVPFEGWSWSEETEAERFRVGIIDVDWSNDSLADSRVITIADGKPAGNDWGLSPQRTVAKGDTVYAIGHNAITVIDLPTAEVTTTLHFR